MKDSNKDFTLNGQEKNIILEMRESYRQSIGEMGIGDEISNIFNETIIVGTKNINMNIYVPSDNLENASVLLFIHDGGFVSGDLTTHDILVRKLALDNNAIVVYPEYSLAPENKFPEQFIELESILEWINDHIVNFGGNKNKLFLIGDSAGGNLVLGLVHKNQNIQKFDIKGQILMYPDTSFEYTTHSINENSLFHFPTKEILYTVRKAYLNNEYEIYNTLVSPLLANVSNIPPTLVITAENNPLRDEAILYHEKLLHENRDSTHFNFKDMEHGFIQYYQHPRNSQAAENALSEIKRWVSNKISNEIV